MPNNANVEAFRVTEKQRNTLEHWIRCATSPKRLVERCQIILALSDNFRKKQVARELGKDKKTVQKWCRRWQEAMPRLSEAESEGMPHKEYIKLIAEGLNDAPRRGAPPTFTPEQVVQIVALACEVLDSSDGPTSQWTYEHIAQEAMNRNIVDTISRGSVWRFLKRSRP